MDSIIRAKAPKHLIGKIRRVKTFTGCWSCRSRKIKCDDSYPECTQCRKSGVLCQGYEPNYTWVTSKQTYEPGRRRMLPSHLTWQGSTLLSPAALDKIIAQFYFEEMEQSSDTEPSHAERRIGPFGVFKCQRQNFPEELSTLQSSLIPSLSPNFTTLSTERSSYLLYHYTKHIALNMMPFKDERNPWQSYYPYLAQCSNSPTHKSLFHAILAQAATNLAWLGSERAEMLVLAVQHHTDAIHSLRESLKEERIDYSTTIATILTLIMVEVYGGNSEEWRQHLTGGWAIVKSQQGQQPWLESDFAWLATQSLCLLKIRTDTVRRSHTFTEDSLIASVALRTDFGFTAGANQALVICIQSITNLKERLLLEGYTSVVQESIDQLQQQLADCCCPDSRLSPVVQCHHRIFHTGVMIYFYRSIWDHRPRDLAAYLSFLFNDVALYRSLGGGHITLWPVFVAAVEAYCDTYKAAVKVWFETEDRMGAASRLQIRMFIERVWSLRLTMAEALAVDEGAVVVDWAEKMQEWGMDILLV